MIPRAAGYSAAPGSPVLPPAPRGGTGEVAPLYVAARACSGCPYRAVCHEPRQHAQELHAELETGRHYLCEFYRSHRRRERERAARLPRPGLLGWLRDAAALALGLGR